MLFDYEWFKKEIFKFANIDLNSYKEQQMKRRIDSLINKNKFSGYREFLKELVNNKNLYGEFLSHLTINVSEFYRNPEQWKILEQKILPKLIKSKGNKIKIWSAACSTGDEPYTLVMLMAEFMPLNEVKVLATDIDDQIIAEAQKGIYNSRSLNSLPDKWKNTYFKKVGNVYYIDDLVKSRVEFRKHDLLLEEYISDCDLIVCRNVLIYFTNEAKNKMFQKFYNSLVDDGVLFIGSTEQISNYQNYGFSRKGLFFYNK